jgi:Uma2 family endonuclease
MSAPRVDLDALFQALVDADENGYRLEIMNGVGIWEVQPSRRHVRATLAIERSIRPAPDAEGDCGCVFYPDLYVRFSDGSLKRPDISIFCREPDELDEAVTLVPEAVVEVVSRGFEAKDYDMNPPFYLSRGVKDVIIMDPYNLSVIHHRVDSVRRLTSPVEIRLECGCLLTA